MDTTHDGPRRRRRSVFLAAIGAPQFSGVPGPRAVRAQRATVSAHRSVLCWCACMLGGAAPSLASPPPRTSTPPPPPAIVQRCLAAGVFPAKLSATGCYADLSRQTPSRELVPYDISAPLWSDGASKRRFFVVPPGQKIGVSEEGRLEFPFGAVIVKEFRMARQEGRPDTERPVETRFMLRTEAEWLFRTYEWNDQGTEANLRPPTAPGKELTLAVERPGGKGTMSYYVPSAAECGYCHSSAGAAQVLGPTLAQLSQLHDFGDGRSTTQLAAWKAAGWLAGGVPDAAPAGLVLVDPGDTKAPVETRARAWLHANCAHCHRPGGWVPPAMTLDLRWESSLADMRACGVTTQYLELAPRIDPGHPARSALWRRINSKDSLRMPPIGVSVQDPAAAVIRSWIAELRACPPRR